MKISQKISHLWVGICLDKFMVEISVTTNKYESTLTNQACCTFLIYLLRTSQDPMIDFSHVAVILHVTLGHAHESRVRHARARSDCEMAHERNHHVTI